MSSTITTNNIIIAVNVIFVVSSSCLDHRRNNDFVAAFQKQIDHLKEVAQQAERPGVHPSSFSKGGYHCSLIQSVLGEDFETPGTFHCHLKFQCSSSSSDDLLLRRLRLVVVEEEEEEEEGAVKDDDASSIHPIFLSCPISKTWKEYEDSNPFEEKPSVAIWRIAPPPSPQPQSTDNNIIIPPKNPKPIPTTNGQPTTIFCMNANLYIQPSYKTEFIQIIENARTQSIQEPLCIEYQYGPSLSNSNIYHVHQEYIGHDGGKEGFDAHAKTPHYQRWKQFAETKNPFTKEPMAYVFRSKSSSSSSTYYHHQPPVHDNTLLLLDGGNGHQLKLQGIINEDGSFLAGLLANEQQPHVVKSVHKNFRDIAGCHILTTNNFVAVPKRIQKDILLRRKEKECDDNSSNDNPPEVVLDDVVHQRTKELIVAAVKCAKEVAEEEPQQQSTSERRMRQQRVLVAGSVPPLTECYIASEVPKAADDADADDADAYKEMVNEYKFLLKVLIEQGVDILLGETLSTIQEAIAILQAFSQVINDNNNKPPPTQLPRLAISWTIDDFQTNPPVLRSGEGLDVAVETLLEECNKHLEGVDGLWGIGINCCSPMSVTNAILCIQATINKKISNNMVPSSSPPQPQPRIMAYANGFQTTTSEWLASLEKKEEEEPSSNSCTTIRTTTARPEDYDSQGLILPNVYAKYAQTWHDSGASVVGGCCGISPVHLKAVAEKLGILSSSSSSHSLS